MNHNKSPVGSTRFQAIALYGYGRGVERNYVMAYAWTAAGLKLARGESRRRRAWELREGYAKQMTPADIAAAERLANELYAKHRYKG